MRGLDEAPPLILALQLVQVLEGTEDYKLLVDKMGNCDCEGYVWFVPKTDA